MNPGAWEFWTRAAIAVLEVGSVAVFGWFLVDVVRLARDRAAAARRDDVDR